MTNILAGKLGLLANVHIEVRDLTGRLVDERHVKNLVVDAGTALVAQILAGTSTIPTHLAVGDDNTAVDATDTTLGSEVARIQITGRSVVANVLTIYAYLPSTKGNGFSLVEAGLFNAATSGTLFAHVTFSNIAKDANTSVTFTWQFTVTSS